MKPKGKGKVSKCRHPFCHKLPGGMELGSTTSFGHDELKLGAKVNHSSFKEFLSHIWPQ